MFCDCYIFVALAPLRLANFIVFLYRYYYYWLGMREWCFEWYGSLADIEV